MMMVPPCTPCPPKAFTPSRCAFESRPFFELPNPFLCAIAQFLYWMSPDKPRELFLFLRSCLLSRSLLDGLFRGSLLGFRFRRTLASGFRLRRFYLFLLRSLLLQRRSAELLPFKSNLGNAYGRKILPVSAHFLVLLLALQVEH